MFSRYLDNKIIYLNPRFAGALPFTIGDRDPSVSMVVSADEKTPDGYTDARVGHYRSTMNPSNRTFELKDFPYSDSKGGGNYSRAMWKRLPWDPSDGSGIKGFFTTNVMGLLNMNDALYDAEMTEKLIESGVRPGCVISSIARLKEILIPKKNETPVIVPVTSTKIPTWVSNKMFGGVFDKKRMPSVMRRHYSWPIRVIDLANPQLSTPQRKEMIDATIEHVSAKHRIPATYDAYLRWFAQDLAESVALMHVAGLHHWYLHTQNVLVDGGIMDNDSAGRISILPWRKHIHLKRDKDHTTGYGLRTGAKFNIDKLFEHLSMIPSIETELKKSTTLNEIQNIYDAAYNATVQDPEATKARRHVI